MGKNKKNKNLNQFIMDDEFVQTTNQTDTNTECPWCECERDETWASTGGRTDLCGGTRSSARMSFSGCLGKTATSTFGR